MAVTKFIERLEYEFVDCPVYWQNFIRGIEPKESVGVSIASVNKELKKYSAKYIAPRTNTPYIRFDDEKLMQWFKLTWS